MIDFNSIILETKVYNPARAFDAGSADFHIAFGIDRNFARGMGVLMHSICAHNADEKIVFHVFTDHILPGDVERLKAFSQYANFIIILYYIDLRAFKNLPTTLAWSYATYYRFIMGKVLYGKVDKILYLDADILCVGAMKEIGKIDFQDNIALAIAEDGLVNVKRLSLTHGKYFNAGVLYIHIDRWNKEKIAERAIRLLEENPEKFPYLDQDVLNLLLDGKSKMIERKWNHLYDMRKIYDHVPEETVFIHFIGDKPWQEWTQHHFMVETYRQYAEKSPWAQESLLAPVHYKDKKRMAKSCMKKCDYAQAIHWYWEYVEGKIKSRFTR